MRADPPQVDPAAGEGVQRAVAGRRADPPALLVGKVGQRGPVLHAQQGNQAEHQVRVQGGIGDHDVGPLPAVLAEQHVDHVERVADGPGHDLAAEPGGLVVDHVEPGHAALGSEVLAVGPGVDAGDGDDEPHPVDRGDQAAAQHLGERDAGLARRSAGRWPARTSRPTGRCRTRAPAGSGSSAGTPRLGDRGVPDVQGLGGQARRDRDVQVLQPGPAARHRGERGGERRAPTPSPPGSPPAGRPAAASPPPACAGPPATAARGWPSASETWIRPSSSTWASIVPAETCAATSRQRRVQGAGLLGQQRVRVLAQLQVGQHRSLRTAPTASPASSCGLRVAPAGRGPGVDLAALEVPVRTAASTQNT